jgi:hypothetical protein
VISSPANFQRKILLNIILLALLDYSSLGGFFMKSVLVYGDLMIDKTWVVQEKIEDSIQPHGDVVPLRRIAPGRLDESLGGAGTIAATLTHFCAPDVSVQLLCYSGLIENKILGDVTLHRLLTSGDPLTTIKFRIWTYRPDADEKPELKYRFDQDAPVPKLTGDLPDLPQLDLIIISDFKKGTVQPAIIDALLMRYPNTPLLVDSKNERLFQANPSLRTHGGTLFVNRDEANRFWQVEATDASEKLDISGSVINCRTDLLKLGKSLLENLPKWNLIVKLDREGAFLFSGREYAEFHSTPIVATGISAGDIFLSAWVQAQLHNSDLCLTLKHATITASEWVRFSSSITSWELAWNANHEAPTPLDFSPKEPVSNSEDPVFHAVETEL